MQTQLTVADVRQEITSASPDLSRTAVLTEKNTITLRGRW